MQQGSHFHWERFAAIRELVSAMVPERVPAAL
jgi:hypothetical protein